MRRSGRREFIRRALGFACGAALGGGAWAQGKARVALVEAPELSEVSGRARREVYGKMLAQALRWLGLSFRRLFSRHDRVGIKVNCLGGPHMCTDPQLAYAIAERLLFDVGVNVNNIIVFDRQDAELAECGYILNTGARGLRCMGNDNPKAGYEERLTREGAVSTRLSNIVTTMITALVNVPVLKDHRIAGLTAALKNHFGCIHSPNKYHPGRCDPFVADVNMIRAIRNNQRLIVCDCREVLYEGGPDDAPEYHYRRNAILVSTDPVALDVIAWRMVDAIRNKHGLGTLAEVGRPPTYIATAASADYNLGVGEMGRIQLIGGDLL